MGKVDGFSSYEETFHMKGIVEKSKTMPHQEALIENFLNGQLTEASNELRNRLLSEITSKDIDTEKKQKFLIKTIIPILEKENEFALLTQLKSILPKVDQPDAVPMRPFEKPKDWIKI